MRRRWGRIVPYVLPGKAGCRPRPAHTLAPRSDRRLRSFLEGGSAPAPDHSALRTRGPPEEEKRRRGGPRVLDPPPPQFFSPINVLSKTLKH